MVDSSSGTRQVTPQLAGASLAGAVHALFAVSWGRARDWIESGKIVIEGERCTDVRRPVLAGAQIELQLNARRPRPLVDRVAGAIVYCDDHVVVLDKPPGLSTVAYEEGERDTLAELVLRAVSGRHRRRGRRPTLGIVHRLDRETSGLMVFALSWMAKVRLGEQFRAHTVRRHYLALVHGAVASQTIRTHLVRDRGDGLRGSRERSTPAPSQPAKLAVTHVELLERLHGASLIRCRLETGRTHQIRIHLGELGHPVLGERAYVRDHQGEVLSAPRLMLHAAELGFDHPADGRPVRWELPLPADMQEVAGALRGGTRLPTG